ncbi:hypothetical protein FRB91_001504, partial [Serendipita sp. 411]
MEAFFTQTSTYRQRPLERQHTVQQQGLIMQETNRGKSCESAIFHPIPIRKSRYQTTMAQRGQQAMRLRFPIPMRRNSRVLCKWRHNPLAYVWQGHLNFQIPGQLYYCSCYPFERRPRFRQ